MHEPCFSEVEKQRLLDVIGSGFVSSVGAEVSAFEKCVAEFVGTRFAIATNTGTAALHVALLCAEVGPQDEVITQAMSFVATSNAIRYCGATPVFIDVDRKTLGMSAEKLGDFLAEFVVMQDGQAVNKQTGKRLSACVPMHTFGHPCQIDAIVAACKPFNIPVVEDAAEALGSQLNGQQCGSFGAMGVFSFNGNKIMTTGGGGMVVTDDERLAQRLRFLTTTAKAAHPWEFRHTELGYNYRMPNLNAALGLGQIEKLEAFIHNKRALAAHYQQWSRQHGVECVVEPPGARSNYWLNALILDDKVQRDAFLQKTNAQGVMSRPVWALLHRLPMYQDCLAMKLEASEWLADRLVNIPSSVRLAGDGSA